MTQWLPHVTVATVIEDDSHYLLVEERDKASGALVFNQPAGHLERAETLPQAALRETLEETGWEIELVGILGVALYTAPVNNNTYFRTTFLGRPLRRVEGVALDTDIHAIHWLDYEAICARAARMRSAMVIADIERHRSGILYPLGMIRDFQCPA
jgi:8-oxo-dGTP pyrophosphatase MutT (NUDIX family)